MRHLFLIILFFSYYIQCFAQSPQANGKSRISSNDLGQWPYVSNPNISPNGEYISYTKAFGYNSLEKSKLSVLNTTGSWRKEFTITDRWSEGFFSGNSKEIVFSNVDTLFFLQLGKGKMRKVSHVKKVKKPKNGKVKWLAYQLDNPSKELVLINLLDRNERSFFNIDDYSFDEKGTALLIKRDSSHTLQWVNLYNGRVYNIWSSDNSTVKDCNFDSEGTQLVFIEQKKDGKKNINSMWYYKKEMIHAELQINSQSAGIEPGLSLSGSPQFSKNGKYIFFQLEEQSIDKAKLNNDAVMVDIWSYKDLIIQPEQRRLGNAQRTFAATFHIEDKKVIRLENSDELLLTSPGKVNGNWVVIMSNSSNNEFWWNLSSQPSFYLMSLKNGNRKILKAETMCIYNFSFSPQGKYLVYYDTEQENYFSCNTITGKIINITKSIPTKVSSEYIRSLPPDAVAGIAGWSNDEDKLLIYDNYDVWQIDVNGIRSPVNITNGYGLANQIKFRIVNNQPDNQDQTTIIFDKYTSLLLTAFNTKNKYNGFYNKKVDDLGNPKLLTMGHYIFYMVDSQKPHFIGNGGMKPIKAEDANVWVIERQSATESPNYFLTRDFKGFKPLSNIHPESNSNWLNTELITWNTLDGVVSQGILYKPENFNPNRKYPVIFNYYEKLSHRLNEFLRPDFTGTNINIPWFVSNGYLVFTPDIHYEIASKSGKSYGEWAYNSVVSAAQYLSTMPYINNKKMAVQGHSFGAGETNYILTHTNIFAAAAEAAGVSDRVSNYLTLAPFMSSIEHSSTQTETERGHSLTGATLWERPDLYIKSSAVLNADKVATPLLIMHNEKDNQIPWRQGVEFYMALRRLGKKSWMLQYDNGDHGVIGNDAKDYTIRLTQFFDHYLKDKPAPVWMTRGVPFSKKGIETGYEMDTTGAIP
jgi:dienelactone hydrolase